MGRFSRVGAAFLRLCAVLGPVLLCLLTILYTGRPSVYFLAAGAALAVAILATDAWIVVVSDRAIGSSFDSIANKNS